MTWSLITHVYQQTLTGGVPVDAVSDVVITQRVFSGFGIAQAGFDVDPGAVTGKMVLEGRLHDNAPWGEVFTKNGNRVEMNFIDLDATTWGMTTAGVTLTNPQGYDLPLLPFMRLALEAVQPTNTAELKLTIAQ